VADLRTSGSSPRRAIWSVATPIDAIWSASLRKDYRVAHVQSGDPRADVRHQQAEREHDQREEDLSRSSLRARGRMWSYAITDGKQEQQKECGLIGPALDAELADCQGRQQRGVTLRD